MNTGGRVSTTGLVRFDEARHGAVNHAIRVTFSSTREAWVNPASHCAGDTPNPNAPPTGLRLRLGVRGRALGGPPPSLLA